MTKLAPLLATLALLSLGCGSDGDGGTWGGYTEAEAKGILADPMVRRQILQHAPGDPRTSPLRQLVPTKEQVEESDLRKSTLEGQEAWEYKDDANDFCIYVWEDQQLQDFTTHVGPCIAD